MKKNVKRKKSVAGAIIASNTTTPLTALTNMTIVTSTPAH